MIRILLFQLFGCFILISCSNNNSTKGLNIATADVASIESSNPIVQENKINFPDEIIGSFYGSQQSYNLKNKDGDEIIIRGNPVIVPAYNVLFSLSKNGNVQFIQQAENGEKVFYNGSFKILDNDATGIRVECNVKEANGTSSPTYTLVYDKTSNAITCRNNSEPIITLNRLDNQQINNSNQLNNSTINESNKFQSVDGTYTFSDNSVNIRISVNGNSWSGKTVIISGFGSDNDNQNAQYDNGVVNGSSLFDASGLVEIGHINGRYLTTTIADQTVTLQKQ